MVKSLSDDILLKIDELVSYIKDSSAYKKYQKISEKMQHDENIMQKIDAIKNLQKKIVKRQYDKKDYQDEEREIDRLLEELNSYPIYQEYTYLLEDLNSNFQEIRCVIEDYLNKKLN